MISLILLLAQTSQAAPPPPATVSAASPPAAVAIAPTWTPHRIFDNRTGAWTDLEAVAVEMARADVIFLGEQHDDDGTHRMQRALIEAIGRRRDVVLSLEMFERDVQISLDQYLSGAIREDSMLAASRPWPAYTEHYRPLVEWSRAHDWPVIAANVPRRFASAVARGGLGILDTLGTEERSWAARVIDCPTDAYFDRFAETMRAHVPGENEAEKAASLERYYHSQCLKDETMAESIVNALEAGESEALVVHVNGAFHSDYHLGTAARVQWRLPHAKILVLSAVPVADMDSIEQNDDSHRLGDFLLYTLKP